ncbi:hypothetical protein GQ43DRAFT_443178 [Delitschia confertaspora ATCC 74209]|uniref:Uncharacterized protein n=1 Tax=Delitschia confertaspora ATCC 74209 TaxID=1513339 RepID=A0A9P4JFV2_9PLEO|nr:hypothetical protein GQ43DRAFT_443178 [Delitschia confertaspora ATCC 74209]
MMAPSWLWPNKVDNGYRSVRASKGEKFEAERGLLSHDGTRQSSSTDSLHSDDAILPEAHPVTSPRRSRMGVAFSVLNAVMFICSVVLFIALPYRRPNELNWALKQVSSYSPILDQIEIPLTDRQVNGELFPGPFEKQNLGRKEPSPETTEEWQDYEIQRPFVLSREQVIAMGKDPEKTVKYPNEDWGLGDEAYMGGMDIFHVLHCFNNIRQEAFKDYFWDGEKYHMEGYGEDFKTPKRVHTEIYWIHLRHCTDIILQNLMCNADATMTTYTWLETQERAWPDFSVNRKCRDIDALVKWRDANALNIAKAGALKKPYDQVKVSEYYWRIYGNETHKGDNRHHPLWD